MNGSRANPNIKKDQYQDYDIVFVVTETATFLSDKSWISVFGDIAMVQEPDANDLGWGQNADYSRSYTWLILFKDENRIDLHIEAIEASRDSYTKDSLTVPLLDKDKRLPPIPPSNDSGYWIKNRRGRNSTAAAMSFGGVSTMWQKESCAASCRTQCGCITKQCT